MQGSANRSGHVKLSIGSPRKPPYVRVGAHIFAWEQANGRTVPDGLVVMHSCDNGRCANPAHLSVGTQRDNILDSIRKGRYNAFGRQKLNASKVHQIRALAARGFRQKDIAAQFGIKRHSVSAIVNGKSWAHLPFVVGGSLAADSSQQTAQPSLSPLQQDQRACEAMDRVFERVPSVQLEIRGEVA